MGFRTIREGEQAVIYKLNGEGNLVIGPQRVINSLSEHQFPNSIKLFFCYIILYFFIILTTFNPSGLPRFRTAGKVETLPS
jgi:hypothetical protein